MKLGVVGLPNVGKSTLFNAITKAGAQAANFPFCTIDPNVGVVGVPDERLDVLANMYSPKKVTHAAIEFVDIAGLVKGASRGEGLGNKFLSHIRQVDAIVHVVRCFESADIVHVDGSVDALRDIETINYELIFADMETLDRRIDTAAKNAKSGNKAYFTEIEFLKRLKAHLESGKPIRSLSLTPEEQAVVEQLFLLTDKPVLYVANVSEDEAGCGNAESDKVIAAAKAEGSGAIVLSVQTEQEISELDDTEKAEFIDALGLGESGLDKLVKACYSLLGLISFLTAGEDEVRAWTIVNGTRAPQAAGKIHTDFEKGFIRAEVVPYDTLVELGSQNACKEKGLVRSEGKDYVMKDGDVVLFRFSRPQSK